MIPFELPENVKTEIQGTPTPIVVRGWGQIGLEAIPKGQFRDEKCLFASH